jgi:hypothetical protein
MGYISPSDRECGWYVQRLVILNTPSFRLLSELFRRLSPINIISRQPDLVFQSISVMYLRHSYQCIGFRLFISCCFAKGQDVASFGSVGPDLESSPSVLVEKETTVNRRLTADTQG